MRSVAGSTGYPPTAREGRHPRGGPDEHTPHRTPTRSNSGNPFEDLIIMGTTKSSESMSMAEFLRSQRTTTQADVDKVAAERDVNDVSADERWSSVAH